MKTPNITKTTHILPFGELSPLQFERLCLWIVDREGYLRPEHLGETGSEQGRDVIAYRKTKDGEELWYFQCKRYQTINAAKLIEEVKKYNKLVRANPTKKPSGIVFVTNAALAAAAREKVRAFCRQQGYESEFWARTELDLLVKKHSDIVAEFFNVTLPSPLPRDRISIARLPVSASDLFGRDEELKLLDEAWEEPKTNVITFVAWGGVGKTALINHWLKRRMAPNNYRNAVKVYAWSFYSQGTNEQAVSADLFIDQALRWFGDTDPTQGSPWEKGERLASLVRQTRTLLILDGLEPLQQPPGYHEGRVKDAALQALIVGLAAYNPGLCIISTRERVTDLEGFENAVVIQHRLEHLSVEAGVQLLRARQIKGDDSELQQAVQEFGGHALALTLLASYLADVCESDIRRRGEVENLEEDTRYGGHAERVMRAYEKWLGEGLELAILRLLGLFNRPADIASITALRQPPAISGLTESLQNFKAREWGQAVAKLRRIGLLGETIPAEPGTLDAHPLVREHFKQQLKRRQVDAWREGNNRLYEHLKTTAKAFPTTLQDMSLLYEAVAHGCEANRYQQVMEEVLERRIHRGKEQFSWKKLGAFGAELEALSKFFDPPWQRVVTELNTRSQMLIQAWTAYHLSALGRPLESIQLSLTSLELAISQGSPEDATIAASNLGDLYLLTGDLRQALIYFQQSVNLADESPYRFWWWATRSSLANALHQTGNFAESRQAFTEAEAILKSSQPSIQFLYSYAGFEYCELLLDQGKYEEVSLRANASLEWAILNNWLLDIAVHKLALGRSLMLKTLEANTDDFSEATTYLEEAVSGLRKAGQQDDLPRGLLARAELNRLKGAYDPAQLDLAEIFRIAVRGNMELHLADYHLESVRLQLAQGNIDNVREHLTAAKAIIERTGYHRRDNEISDLAIQLTRLKDAL